MEKNISKVLNEYPDCPRVAVGVAVLSDQGRFLMVKRAKPPAQNYWSVPGGSIELGETIFEAAYREVKEETGITCRPYRVFDAVDAIYRDSAGRIQFHYVILYVAASAPKNPPKAMDDALEARWFNLEEIKGLETPGRTVEILAKLL